MHDANPDSIQTEGPAVLEPPEKSQWSAIVLTVLVLVLWVLWSVYAEHFVGPVISIFEWFEQTWGLDILPGREA